MQSTPSKGLRFLAFSRLPYTARLWVALCALMLGVLCQVLVGWWFGAPMVFVGGLLLVPKGMTNKETHAQDAVVTWEKVTRDEIARCATRLEEARTWSKQANCGAGVVLLMLILMGGGGFMCFLWTPGALVGSFAGTEVAWLPRDFGYTLAFDCIALSFLVLLGTVRSWVPEKLSVHLPPIQNVLSILQRIASPDLVSEPMFQIAQSKAGQLPLDVRAMVKFKNAPASFMGLQVQVSTNSVESVSFPYLYCVILAKPDFGLADKIRPFLGPPPTPKSAKDRASKDKDFSTYAGQIVELSNEGEVDVAVIRQVTFGTGYHTKPAQQAAVFQAALELARNIMPQVAGPKTPPPLRP
jgi:hypothetical protein